MPGGTARTVLRAARGNAALGRVLVAYAGFSIGEFAIWITLLVYAYDRYGATGATGMVLVQLIPSIAVAPIAGTLADRYPPAGVLLGSYAGQGLALGAMAAAVGLHAPAPVVFVLASLAALVLDVTRPAQASLLPSVVRSPTELTTANAVSAWIDGAGSLVGPAVAGGAIALGGIDSAVAVAAALNLVAAGLVPRRAGLAHVRRASRDDGSEPRRVLENVRTAAATPATRLLLGFTAFYYLLVGALDVLCVVLAVSLLHLSDGVAGYFNAAIGAGATIAGLATFELAGRRRLAVVAVGALFVSVVSLTLMGSFPTEASVVTLLALIGFMGTVFLTVDRTLLQRVAPPDSTGAMFAVVEGVSAFGLAAGAVVVRLGIAIGGLRAALFAPAILGAAVIALSWGRLRKVDESATIPQVEVRLLRSIPMFAPLSAAVLEGVARALHPTAVPTGGVVVREGDPGDRYYAVADGQLLVTRAGAPLRRLARGSGFGEVALVANTTRTATVTAETDALLYGLDKETFLRVMTGHASRLAVRNLLASYDDLPGDEEVDLDREIGGDGDTRGA